MNGVMMTSFTPLFSTTAWASTESSHVICLSTIKTTPLLQENLLPFDIVQTHINFAQIHFVMFGFITQSASSSRGCLLATDLSLTLPLRGGGLRCFALKYIYPGLSRLLILSPQVRAPLTYLCTIANLFLLNMLQKEVKRRPMPRSCSSSLLESDLHVVRQPFEYWSEVCCLIK